MGEARRTEGDRAETELPHEEARALLRTIMRSAPAGLGYVDRTCRYRYVNRALAEINGLPAEEHAGRTIAEVLPRLWPSVEPLLRHVLDTGESLTDVRVSGEVPALPGEERHWRASYHAVEASGGEVLGVAITVVDVTDQRRAEAALQFQRDRFDAVAASVPGVICAFQQLDGRWAIPYASAGLLDVTGIRPEAVTSDASPFLRLIHPDDVSALLGALARDAESAAPFQIESRYRHPGKGTVWLETRCAPSTVGDGGVLWHGIVVDVSERRRVEGALRVSEEQFRKFMHFTPAQVWVDDENGVNRFANPALARELGRPVDQIIGRPLAEFMPGAPIAEYLESNRRVLETGQTFQAIVSAPRHDGSLGRFLIHKFPLGASPEGRRQLGGVAIDVTEHERAREALRASQESYRTLFEYAPDGIVVSDADGRFKDANASICSMLGYTREELIALNASEVVVESEIPFIQPALRAAQSKVGYFREWQFRRRDGSTFPAEVRARLMPDSSIIGMIRDVTDRTRTEAELRASELQFRHWIEGVKDQAIYLLGADGTIATWSAGAEQITGYSAPEVVGQPHAMLYTAEDVANDQPRSDLEISAEAGRHSQEGWRVRKDGTRIWVNGTLSPRYDAEGRLQGFVKIVRDLTEERRAAATRREHEARMQLIVHAAGIGLWDWNLVTDEVYFSDEWKRQLGYVDAEPPTGSDAWKLLHPDDRADAREAVNAYIEGRRPDLELEVRLRHHDGSWRWILQRASLARDDTGAPVHLMGCNIDVTERRLASDALRQSEQKLRDVIDGLGPHILVGLLTREGVLIEANRSALAAVGLSAEDVLNVPFDQLHPWSYSPEVQGQLRDAIARAARGESSRYDVQLQVADGSLVWIDFSIQPLRDPSGEISYLVPSANVIDDRKRAEDALKLSERSLMAEKQFIDTLLDSLPGVVFLLDAGGRFQRWNKMLEAVTGHAADVITVLSPLDLVAPREREAVSAWLRSMVGSGPHTIEVQLLSRETTIPYYLTGVRLGAPDESLLLGIGIDVSDRKELEKQLQQAQKMEAVGQLAGGVAHDFNNLLTVISGNTDLLAEDSTADERRQFVEEIRDAAQRAASLTRRLLAFSRQTVLEARVLDLNVVIDGTSSILRRLIGEDVQLTTVLEPDLRRVRIDSTQMEQVLLNLAINARDAMPTGGTVRIETANVELDDRQAAARAPLLPGSHAMVSVNDTGAGMTPEIRERIFEPFFTTKGLGKGTGLGLSMVFGIIRQSGGAIDVESEPGKGTTFRIYLPAVEGEEPAARPREAATDVGGDETVLLVEDEGGVRTFALRVLKSRGYDVLVARDGAEALEIANAHVGPIELLFTDVVMPGCNGKELSDMLRSRFPALRTLFASGYTDDAVVRHGVLHSEVAFVQKPYSAQVLARKVREVLDRRD